MLQWAVYVDGVLVSWDVTRAENGELVLQSLENTLYTPEFRDAAEANEFSHEINSLHTIVVAVKRSQPTAGGNFTVEVDTSAVKPMQSQTIRILDPPKALSITATAKDWIAVQIPSAQRA